jgi:NAD(P)-dependent dehydrogenase (short-subunit alcohol dehydrogenase family)
MNDDRTGSLSSRRVIVTGAGQGLGEATARYLAARGARVLVADIQEDKARTVANAISDEGGAAVATTVDVRSWESAQALVQTAVEALGGLDGLVNNAGISLLGGPLEDVDADMGRRMLEVNLVGAYQVGLAAIHHMADHGGGAIVNVTSGVQAGLSDAAAYSASKGGVASLTYSWAIDLAGHGIRVNAISPVATTEMTQEAEARMRARGELSGETPVIPPSRNCAAIAYLISEESRNVNGQVLRVHDRLLQLIAHPVVMDEVVCEGEEWTVAGVAEAITHRFSPIMPPLGLTAASVSYRPMSVVNVVPGIDLGTGEAASPA